MLYWITVAYIVGVPNFLQFDGTGRTHDFGLFNITSISRIALTLLTTYLLTVNLAMSRGPVFPRKVKLPAAAWISLLVWCIIATILQPKSRLSPHLATDLPLSLFRLGEWVVAFMLFLALYTRESDVRELALVIELIGRSSWITIFMVWIAWPFVPNLVLGITDEPGSTAALGGLFVQPAALAFHASCAFLYTLFFFKRPYYRWLGCLFCVITLVLTRARTPLVGFAVALLCYALVFSRNQAVRSSTVVLLGVIASVFAAFRSPILAFLSRGQDSSTLTTLDNKLPVWIACWSAIKMRPILGYGYVIGAKYAIRDYWLQTSLWVPPHAHNELIQATLQAGLPACIILAYLYVWLFVRCLRTARTSRRHIFLFLVVIQLTVIGTTGVVLSTIYSSLGAVMILCYVGLSGHDERRVQVWESGPTPTMALATSS